MVERSALGLPQRAARERTLDEAKAARSEKRREGQVKRGRLKARPSEDDDAAADGAAPAKPARRGAAAAGFEGKKKGFLNE